MKRVNSVFILVFVIGLLITFTRPATAATDHCALLKTEADALLSQAGQATPEEAQRLKNAAQNYSAPCAKPFSDDSLVSIWKYDAANPDNLQYGAFSDKHWSVVGQGSNAYFQGTAPGTAFSSVLAATIQFMGFQISNIATYRYQGTDYPLYSVVIDDKTRVLPLIKKGRGSDIFFDPLSGELRQWQGNWQTLNYVLNPYIAVEVSFQVRLDTQESFFKAAIPLGESTTDYVAVQISPNGVLAHYVISNSGGSQATPINTVTAAASASTSSPTATPTAIAKPTLEVGKWYALRMLVQSSHFQAFLDKIQVVDIAFDNFLMPGKVFPGFLTSAAPATVSLNAIEVKTNFSPSQ